MPSEDTLAELVENFAYIDCGIDVRDYIVRDALAYLPGEVLNKHRNSLVIVSVPEYIAVRLTKRFYANRDIIVLSESLFPQKHGGKQTDEEFRFFTYTVLHEVAHAVCNHKSQTLDGLTPDENERQEAEARALAVQWFNKRIQKPDKKHHQPLTVNEVEKMEAKRRNE
jgi:hypothetical protein